MNNVFIDRCLINVYCLHYITITYSTILTFSINIMIIIIIIRIGYLYGRVQSDASVKVEFIYEPPQETTDVSFIVLDDPKEVS